MADNDQHKTNWEEFERLEKNIGYEDIGRTSLLHDGKLVAIYNDNDDAYQIGVEKFGAGNFSVQTFGEKPKSLGLLATHGIIFDKCCVMPTFSTKIINNQIIIIAGVSNPDLNMPSQTYSAIVDTGAQGTVVSKNVI
ncbi:MAG: hypothetical protein OXC62_12950 [Aestuariivita sp.]|nr:hypothetical protein [Aestuariivita sp.]